MGTTWCWAIPDCLRVSCLGDNGEESRSKQTIIHWLETTIHWWWQLSSLWWLNGDGNQRMDKQLKRVKSYCHGENQWNTKSRHNIEQLSILSWSWVANSCSITFAPAKPSLSFGLVLEILHKKSSGREGGGGHYRSPLMTSWSLVIFAWYCKVWQIVWAVIQVWRNTEEERPGCSG